MMLYGIVNVYLYIESLRVIDLIRKGIYNIRIKCFKENEPNLLATPIIGITEKYGEAGHNIRKAEIQEHCYSSKQFFVSYFKEFITIQNSCIFQLELPLNEFYKNNLIIEFELIQHNEQDGATEEIVAEKVVCQQRVRINSVGRGVQQFFPIIFTEWYFSVLKTVINTSLVNIVNRAPTSPYASLEYGSSGGSRDSLTGSGNSVGIFIGSNSPKSSASFRRSVSPAFGSPQQQNNTPNQKLLNSSSGNIVTTDSENNNYMNDRYPEFQSYLVETYCRTVDKYKKLLLLLKQSQQSTLGDLLNIPPLNIPPLNTWKSAISPTSSPKSSLRSKLTLSSSSLSPPSATSTPTTSTTSLPPASTNKIIVEVLEKISIEDNNHNNSSGMIVDDVEFGSSFGSINSSGGGDGSACSSTASIITTTTTTNGSNNVAGGLVSTPSTSKTSSPTSTLTTGDLISSSSAESLSRLLVEDIPMWKRILNNLQKIADQVNLLWDNYIKIFLLVAKEHTFKLSLQYENKCIERWDRRTQRMTLHIQDLQDLLLVDSSPPTSSFVQSYFQFKALKVETVPVKLDSVYDALPIFFEQKIKFHQLPTVPVKECDLKKMEEEALRRMQEEQEQITEELNQQHLSSNKRYMLSVTNNPGRHLFIFVHGLSGNSYDLRQFKNYFSIHFPMALYLICSSIEENTLDDIQQLGEKIATEVSDYLQENLFYNITRISFIGHSLGGIVVRSALTSTKLKAHLSKLHTYVSLSSPHLGVKFSGSNLVPSAMWVWQKFSNSICLKQLLMQDTTGPLTDCFLYKLSQSKSLEYFKYIILVGSEQDGYVPFHSARIELPKDALKDKIKSSVVKTMLHNILSPIKEKPIEYSKFNLPIESMIKLNVLFESHKGVDGVIGRSAHIRMLDQPWFIQMFIQLYKAYWE